jgi:inorganic triphosphatase YgiF
MAEDLHRFLEDKPIWARRISGAERAWRLMRRNPLIAATSTLAFVLLLTVAAVSTLAYFQTREALTQTNIARQDALKAKIRAEENLDLAADAFESIFQNMTRRGEPQSLQLPVPMPNC